MAKRKRRTHKSQVTIGQKIGVVLIILALSLGCYFYLRQENKLPASIENIRVEKIWKKTVTETEELKDKFLDKVETGLEDVQTKIKKERAESQKERLETGAQKERLEAEMAKAQQQKAKSTAPASTPSHRTAETTPSGKTSKAHPSSATTTQSHNPGSLNLKLEIPVSTRAHEEILLKRIAYTASYNKEMKNPNWVAWELTRKELSGEQERTNKFVPDPDLPEPRAKSSDYTRTGYDRGHMAPAADMKWSAKAMEESFYMSNICPQHKNLNRGDWNDLEDACRAWAKKYGTVYIACGPIYDHKRPKRIGANQIAVPDRFFKVVLIYNRKDPMALGFIFPNVARSQDLVHYQVKVDDIEDMTGWDFFSRVPDSIENQIEAQLTPLPSTKN